jgi:hypothetical protein
MIFKTLFLGLHLNQLCKLFHSIWSIVSQDALKQLLFVHTQERVINLKKEKNVLWLGSNKENYLAKYLKQT